LLGCDTVQVCTQVMKVGYRCLHAMADDLAAFMDRHAFSSIEQFKGHSLQYFTTHADLVRRQAEARKAARDSKAAAAPRDKEFMKADSEWSSEDFVRQTDSLSRG
jgi:hypothetical protein